uniref:Ubiquitin-like domain-containing protein n=1 Tax=viral metagenome TaxID=1070528 RepID=A0A6C0AF10_9ZZZZ
MLSVKVYKDKLLFSSFLCDENDTLGNFRENVSKEYGEKIKIICHGKTLSESSDCLLIKECQCGGIINLNVILLSHKNKIFLHK